MAGRAARDFLLVDVNKWQISGSSKVGVNVRHWVSFAELLAAAVDQLTPFFSKGVNGGFSQNPPINLCEHDVRLRDLSQPSPY